MSNQPSDEKKKSSDFDPRPATNEDQQRMSEWVLAFDGLGLVSLKALHSISEGGG